MEILGRDSVAECYRVRSGDTIARLPDATISRTRVLTGGHGHQTAHEWIARHAPQIERAVDALNAGQKPPAPFDMMELEVTTSGAEA